MKKRILTGIVMAIIFIPILFLGGWFIVGLSTILAYIATFELVRMFNKDKNVSQKYQYIVPIFSALIVLMGGLGAMLPDYFDRNDLVFMMIVIFLLFLTICLFNEELKITDFIQYYGFIIYGGLGIYMILRLRFINDLYGEKNDLYGLFLISYVLLTTMFTDMGAFNVGLLLGKHKLCPKISPKKTIEGAIGGTIIGTVVGTIFVLLVNNFITFNIFNCSNQILNVIIIIFVSFLLSIFAQFGDLIASKLKRQYDIKDYGNIFPGHGGVMDRFDSWIVAGTAFVIILMISGVI